MIIRFRRGQRGTDGNLLSFASQSGGGAIPVVPPTGQVAGDVGSSISGGTFVKGRWRKITKKVRDDYHERESDIEEERKALWRRIH